MSAYAEIQALIHRILKARTLDDLGNLEFNAGVSLDEVELDPLASDNVILLTRQLHTEALAAAAQRREELCSKS